MSHSVIARTATFVLLGLFFSHWALADLDWPGFDLKGRPCHGKPSNYGPYDYRSAENRKKKLPVVEHRHFTREIRMLKGYRPSLFGDLGYTLRAFPNHYPALNSMMELQRWEKKIYGPPMECYFNRAEAFVPDDYRVYMLEGIYMRRIGKYGQSLKAFKKAEQLNNKSGKLLYNIGLLYLDMKEYDKAAEYAKRAMERGYKAKRLRRELAEAGIEVKVAGKSKQHLTGR